MKVGQFEATELSNYLESKGSALRDLAAIGQVPAQNLGVDGISNISEAALAALETGKERKPTLYHDHCDCEVVMVVHGKPWRGQEAYEELEALWLEVTQRTSGKDSVSAFSREFRKKVKAGEAGAFVPGDGQETGATASGGGGGATSPAGPPTGGASDGGAGDAGDEKWPKIPGVRTPEYQRVGADGVARSQVFIGPDGRGEQLPDLTRMPGHVLYGWHDRDEHHSLSDRRGHRADSVRPGATTFPESWSDQEIVDRVRATIENPEMYGALKNPGSVRRAVRRTFDDVVVEARWSTVRGRPQRPTAYPVRGPGVREILEDGTAGQLSRPHRDDRTFREVTDDGREG